jgi:hypothetical protein
MTQPRMSPEELGRDGKFAGIPVSISIAVFRGKLSLRARNFPGELVCCHQISVAGYRSDLYH